MIHDLPPKLFVPAKPAIIRAAADHPVMAMPFAPGWRGRGISSAGTLMNILTSNSLVTNLKLCLDAGDISSYSGSGQKWLDRSGLGHDFFLGADGSANTDDPTFNGSPGNVSSNEYFLTDGGDFFRYDGASETWMESLHKDGAVFTIMAMLFAPAGATTGQRLFGNVANNIANNGVTIRNDRMQVFGGSGVALDVTLSAGANANAWNMVGWSISENGGNVSFGYLNGNHNQVSGSDTFNASYTSPSASGTSFTPEILAEGNAQVTSPSGTRIGGIAIWQGSALSKANFDTVWNNWRSRYGL